MARDVVVLGTAGHARSCLDVIASLGWKVRGCIGPPPSGRLYRRNTWVQTMCCPNSGLTECSMRLLASVTIDSEPSWQ